jgi:hypothetical protein
LRASEGVVQTSEANLDEFSEEIKDLYFLTGSKNLIEYGSGIGLLYQRF